MSRPSSVLSQVAKFARFVRDTREALPEVARAAEGASKALREGAALLDHGAKVVRDLSSKQNEKIRVTVVR